MDSVPDSAVCNEAVKLAVKKGFGTLRGFVNGVLRNVARGLDQVEYPTEGIERLSVVYSMPEWILKLWKKTYDLDVIESMLQAFQEETPVTIRCNLAKTTPENLKESLQKEGVTVTPHHICPTRSGFRTMIIFQSWKVFKRESFMSRISVPCWWENSQIQRKGIG